MDISISPIGIIKTPFNELEGMPVQPSGAADIKGTIIINTEYQQGLSDLEGFSHIILLFYLHRSKGYNLMVKPFMDDKKRGVFSTRAPRRPNPIGLSIVELVEIKENIITIKGIDMLNNTPLIDIKPYIPKFDEKKSASAGWAEARQQKADFLKSDSRFIKP